MPILPNNMDAYGLHFRLIKCDEPPNSLTNDNNSPLIDNIYISKKITA